MEIGEKIQKRRKELRMTQAQLAEDLCTQAMISRIEKDKVRPSRVLIEQIAERLEVPLHYFYGENSIEARYSKTFQLKRLIRQHLEQKEYNAVSYLLRSNDSLIKQTIGEDKVFFKWVNGLILAYRDREHGKALTQLIQMEKELKNGELKLEVIDSIGMQYVEKKEYQKAESYFKKGKKVFSEWMDDDKKARLLLHYSIALIEQEKFQEALKLLFQGLGFLIDNRTLYLLGDYYYYKGYCLETLDQPSEAWDAYNKAYTLFDIEKNEEYTLLTKMAKEKLNEQI